MSKVCERARADLRVLTCRQSRSLLLMDKLISRVNGKSRSRFVSRWKINSLLECTGQEGHDEGGREERRGEEGAVKVRGVSPD